MIRMTMRMLLLRLIRMEELLLLAGALKPRSTESQENDGKSLNAKENEGDEGVMISIRNILLATTLHPRSINHPLPTLLHARSIHHSFPTLHLLFSRQADLLRANVDDGDELVHENTAKYVSAVVIATGHVKDAGSRSIIVGNKFIQKILLGDFKSLSTDIEFDAWACDVAVNNITA
jgi:hypothetical protein